MFQYHEGRSQSLNRNEIIWNNSYIKINGSSFFYKNGIKKESAKLHILWMHMIIFCLFKLSN